MGPETEDEELMCRAREGDVDAFSELFRRHRPRVVNFLFRLSWDRERAEDGAQDVFIKLWMARRRYRPSARFTTFLYRVAHNHWVDEVRKRSARPGEQQLDDETSSGSQCHPLLAPSSADPEHELFVRYRQRQIQGAISTLPVIYRTVFILNHLENRKLAEIAEILEIPEGTVKSRLHTAVRMLRDTLSGVI